MMKGVSLENMKKIGIVVVTYNRIECLKKNLTCLENLNNDNKKYEINYYIVNNNSNDGSKEFLDNKKYNSRYNIINLEENTGGAGGFYTGIQTAYNDGNDFIWGMDDDAYPKSDSLEILLKNYSKINEDCALWSNCNNDNDFEFDYKEINSWMFVGFFINKKIIDKVGLPRKDFFIFFDDVEYCNRIIENGFKIFKVRNSIIEHKDSYSNMLSKKILFKTIQIPNFGDWKMYYYVRNKLLMYKKTNLKYWKTLLIVYPKLLIKTLLIKPKQIGIILKAILHGIIRKSGKKLVP